MRIPGVPYVQGRNDYTDSDGRKYGIAIHNTSNDATAEQEASYAQRRSDGISAHLYVDRGSVIQSIDTDDRCGHAGSSNGNNHAVAVEITGTNSKSRQWWLDNVAWDKLGAALAHVVRKYGVEVRRASVEEMRRNPKVRAFYGHDDMRRAWGGTTHTDPGLNFPWDKLFSSVNAALGNETEDDVTKAEFQAWFLEAFSLAMRKGIPWTSPTVRDHAVETGAVKVVNGVPVNMSPWAYMQYTWFAVHRDNPEILALLAEDEVDEAKVAELVLTGLGGVNLDDAVAALVAAFGDRATELAARLAAATTPAGS